MATQINYCVSNLLTQVSSLCFDPFDNLYATNFGPTGNIIKIDKSGNGTVLTNFGTPLNGTCVIYYNNYLYATTEGSTGNSVYKVNPVTGSYSIFSTITNGGATSSYGLTYYQSFLYVVSYNNTTFNGVYKISITDGTNIQTFISATNELTTRLDNQSPYIQFDNDGNFYLCSLGVLKFNNAGTLINATFINNYGINGPFTNFVIYNNNFYFINYFTNKVEKYNMSGNLITNYYADGGATYSGGGLAFDSTGIFYVAYETEGGVAGGVTILRTNVPGTTSSSNISCFNKDTKILTYSGYKLVQDLITGDLVKTLLHGFVPIWAIGKRLIHHYVCKERIKDQLYKCSQTEYPQIFEDLIITGCHSILVDEFISEEQKRKVIEVNRNIYITDYKYRLPVCVDLRSSIYETPGDYTIYHFALENEDYYMNYGVYANGLLVETSSKRFLKELSNMELY